MIFKVYNTETVARFFFNGFSCASLFLSCISLYGFHSGAGILSTLSGVVYLVTVALLSLNNIFRRSPFSIILCYFSFLYLNIPTAFILIEGTDYIIGGGISYLPFAQIDYHESLPLAFLYLTLCWAIMWFGIISVKVKKLKINQKVFSSITFNHILLLGVIVSFVTWFDNQSFLKVLLGNAYKANSLLAFIFFDHAFLVMAGSILFIKLNQSKHIVNSSKIAMIVAAIYITFVFLLTCAGSRAALLGVLILLVIYPLSLAREYPLTRISLPSAKFFMLFVFLSPLVFYIIAIRRTFVSSGIDPDLSTLFAYISAINTDLIADILLSIIYRFSQGGLDTYLLIFQSFVVNTCTLDFWIKFVSYIAKNALNLLLPGTPFLEAYAPSSQLFPLVISYKPLDGNIAANELVKSFNTQPYTIFGVFAIIFSFFSPIFLYFYVVLIRMIYNKTSNVFIKICLLYFFGGTLSSYGIEVVLGNSFLVFVSISFMYFLIKKFSRFHIKLPVKSTQTEP